MFMINYVTRELLKSKMSPRLSCNPPIGDSLQRPCSSASGSDSNGKQEMFIFFSDQALTKDPKFRDFVTLYAEVIVV